MVDEIEPIAAPPPLEPEATRPSLGLAAAIILLTTAPLVGLMYLGARLLNLPFAPFDLFDLPVRVGFAPWIALVNALAGGQDAAGGNVAQSEPLVQWLQGLALFFLLAFAFGLAFYAFVLRRGRIPDLVDGLAIGALFAAPLIFISLAVGSSPLPGLLNAVWLGALCVVWGIVLSYAFGRLMAGQTPLSGTDAPSGEGIGRRQFLVQFGAGAAAITTISAAAGAVLAPGRDAAELQRTLPMIAPELAAAQSELFGNFRRFVIVRDGESDAAESNVLALGAEYPDRNYVSIWIGGHSPIVVYESLQTALAAYGDEEEPAGVYWLDN